MTRRQFAQVAAVAGLRPGAGSAAWTAEPASSEDFFTVIVVHSPGKMVSSPRDSSGARFKKRMQE